MKFIICLLLISVYAAQGRISWDDDDDDWASDLFSSMSSARKNIQKVNDKIQNDIRNQKEKAKVMREKIESDPNAQVSKSSSSSSYSSSSGTTKSVVSGKDSNGKAYRRETEEQVKGNTLYRTVRVLNSETGQTDVFEYTIDLTNPDAEPVPVKKGNRKALD